MDSSDEEKFSLGLYSTGEVPAVDEFTAMIQDRWASMLARAVTEMTSYDPGEYCDLEGWHKT